MRLKMPPTNTMSQTSNYTNGNHEFNNTINDRTTAHKGKHNQLSKTPQLRSTKRYLHITLIKKDKNKTLKPQPKVTLRQTTLNPPPTINQIHTKNTYIQKYQN